MIDVSDPLEPALLGLKELGDPILGLRLSGELAYVDQSYKESTGLVIDVSLPEEPVYVGDHSVRDWVHGAVWRGEWAYRLQSWGVELAEVERLQ